MQEHDLIVEGRCQDGVENHLALADRGRFLPQHCLEPDDPLADVTGQNIYHPHAAKFRQDVTLELANVAVPRGDLYDVVREPLLTDIRLKRLLTAAWIA